MLSGGTFVKKSTSTRYIPPNSLPLQIRHLRQYPFSWISQSCLVVQVSEAERGQLLRAALHSLVTQGNRPRPCRSCAAALNVPASIHPFWDWDNRDCDPDRGRIDLPVGRPSGDCRVRSDGGWAPMKSDDNLMTKAHAAARCRATSNRSCERCKGPPSQDGASAASMVQGAAIQVGRITPPG